MRSAYVVFSLSVQSVHFQVVCSGRGFQWVPVAPGQVAIHVGAKGLPLLPGEWARLTTIPVQTQVWLGRVAAQLLILPMTRRHGVGNVYNDMHTICIQHAYIVQTLCIRIKDIVHTSCIHCVYILQTLCTLQVCFSVHMDTSTFSIQNQAYSLRRSVQGSVRDPARPRGLRSDSHRPSSELFRLPCHPGRHHHDQRHQRP
jgi:hypothetical protein